MEQIILIIHLLVALAIIGLIMLQQGKGADMGASFGAGASQTLFGSDGSGNVLTKSTAWLVVLFFATSFGLAMIADQKAAPQDDLNLFVPEQPAVEQMGTEEVPALDGDLPVVEDDIPAAMSSDAAAEDDIPGLE